METTLVLAFIIGVAIHQKFFAGRSIVPIVTGTLIVALIFNWIFKMDTPPIKIFREVQSRTNEGPA
jgi:hypothetical protein